MPPCMGNTWKSREKSGNLTRTGPVASLRTMQSSKNSFACVGIYFAAKWTCGYVLDSAPGLGVYYFFVVDSVCLSVCMSVCLYVCHAAPSNRFFFVSRWNQPIFDRQFSMRHSTKRFLRFLPRVATRSAALPRQVVRLWRWCIVIIYVGILENSFTAD